MDDRTSFVNPPFTPPPVEACVRLPIPPSINKAYANRKGGRGRGRYKTGAYKAWLIHADMEFFTQKRTTPKMSGALIVEIKVPANTRGDISNRIKLIEDYLVSRNITGDDRNNWKVSIERDASLSEGCRVTMRAA